MDDRDRPLFFEEELSPEQREELEEQLAQDPDLAEDWVQWQQVRRRLRRRLDTQLPDRRLLVLYALEQDGRVDLLAREERKALDAARDEIAEAVDAIPVLEDIIEQIQEEGSDFETVWAEHREVKTESPARAQEEVQSRRRERDAQRPSRTRTAGVRPWAWRLTVAVLLLGAAALAVLYGPRQAARTTVAVESGEQRVVEFGDGSTARVVGAARLSYVFKAEPASRRVVSLERGRAYFDVVHRDTGSFVVNTPTAAARVLGTQFAVTARKGSTEVVLVEGSVEVAAVDESDARSVVLKSGQRSIVRQGEGPSNPSPTDLTSALDWTGFFVFRSAPVETILDRLSDHYDVSITASEQLSGQTVTADFDREQPVSEVVQALARALGATVEEQDGTYHIVPAS